MIFYKNNQKDQALNRGAELGPSFSLEEEKREVKRLTRRYGVGRHRNRPRANPWLIHSHENRRLHLILSALIYFEMVFLVL